MDERDVDSLKKTIITKLVERDEDLENPIQREALGVIRVASDEDDGWGALMLHADGSWSVKVAMAGYALGENPPLDVLLEEYAAIKDPNYQDVVCSRRSERRSYITNHRDELLAGLLSAMEEALRQL